MVRFDVACGNFVAVGDTFCLGGRTYRIIDSDRQVLELLADIANVRHFAKDNPRWLLRYRGEFCETSSSTSPATLVYLALVTRDDGIRRLAIWLRGRMGSSTAMDSLATLRHSKNVSVRRELVRALGRSQAWNWLREIGQSDSSPCLRQFAQSQLNRKRAKPMAIHLRTFMRIPAPSTRQSLYVSPEVALRLSPPKSVGFIRALLERIRRWVHPEPAAAQGSSEPHGRAPGNEI